jgi:ribosomal protein S12 methylthiotransferase accessory factor
MPRGKLITVLDSYEHLAPDALDPRTCGLYQPEFYRKAFPHFQAFTPESTIPWTWGYSFRKGRPILVPEQLVYYMPYRSDNVDFVQECSNGCAIGSCLEEAIFYGLLELIERDAFLMAWYARLAPPRIDPRSSHRPETLFILEAIEKYGYELHLFDTRFDIRIPSVVGVARRKEWDFGYLALAAGCSMDPEDAIRGALCEIASYLPGFRQRVVHEREALQEMAHDYSKVKKLPHHMLLYGLPEMAPHTTFLFQNQLFRTIDDTYHDWQQTAPRNQDLRDDLLFCIEKITQLGMDVIVVDQTSPEQQAAGLKTVCVIVPGLLPISFGWGKDRVFDLPRLRTLPRTAGFRETDFEPDPADVIPHPFP